MGIMYYITKRLVYMVPILLGICLLIFVIFNLLAGDPVPLLLGKHASVNQIAEVRHELGLDKPWLNQYMDVVKSAFTFEFGRSWATKQQILPLVKTATGISLTLVIPAFTLSSLLAIAIALTSAFFRGRLLDRSLVVMSVVMVSVSALAYILFGQWFFAYKLGWFEIAGYDYHFPDMLAYITLPSLILVLLNIGGDVRFYRTVLLDEMYQDYVRTARAKGLPEWVVLYRHVLRNAVIPVVTNIVIQIPSLLLGTVLVESFFGIPGLGGIMINAINNADFPVVKAVTVLSTVFYIIFNVFTDVLYTWLDPRIKLT
jgi:peptide/nickel transport system permease protein